MASKILAAALALMLALFPGLQAARAADMDISTAALSKMYLPQVQLALQDLEQNKIQEAMLQLGIKNESLSPVQIQELKARLKQFLAVYSRARVMYRGGPLPPSFVKKIRAAFSSKGDTDLNVDDFIGEGTQALRRDWAENSKTVLAPSANPYGRVVDQIKKDPAGNVVAYYHIVHLDQVHSLITISTPDKNARNGRSVEEIVFVADQGARQIQHTVYNRQFNGMLRQIVGMYKGDPDAKVPAEVGEYIHDITGIESEAGGAAAHAWSLKDADRYQQVSDIARSFYADSETGTLKKYFLSILTSYLSLATGVKPPKDDKVHQAVEVNAQSLAQLQSIMNSFPSGHLSGIEAALRWLHGASGVNTKISMDDLPPDIRGQSAQIMAEF
ncbi:MAG: hypothetical protein KGL04_07995, partial [Elusimicrobia bacterium]|nr:hypothetical protein [Elusimicrobiota bacterium]